MQRTILVGASLLVILYLPCGAQAPPHLIVLTPITYSNMTTVVLGSDMSFVVHVSSRPAEVLSELSPGSMVADGVLQFDVSAFPTPWSVGDTLVVHIHGAGSNYSQPEDREFIAVLTETGILVLTELGPGGEFFLPVELSSFSAVPQPGAVLLAWATSSEAENAGFNILRASGDSGLYHRRNPLLIPGSGTSTSRHEYSFCDDDVGPETYAYLLESIGTDGSRERFGPVWVTVATSALTLSVGPNPVRGEVTISFSLPQQGPVTVSIHDLGGRVVWSIKQRSLAAGTQVLVWGGRDGDGRSVANGIYICRLWTATSLATARLIIAR